MNDFYKRLDPDRGDTPIDAFLDDVLPALTEEEATREEIAIREDSRALVDRILMFCPSNADRSAAIRSVREADQAAMWSLKCQSGGIPPR